MSLEEREVQRYYQPWLAAHGSSLNVANNVDSIAEYDLKGKGYTPRASRDKALTAFAQLIALRLNVKRCMVSLIDSSNQYILAEATQHNALSGAASDVETGDDLWLGSAILKRPDAICEHCMYNTCVGFEEDGRPYAAKGLIVNDCRLDERFQDRPYVQQEPGVCFYAGVPLFSRHNYMIGALAISDDEPRDGLRASDIRLLQETAQSVMEHLEWARDRVDRFKGERIVRGMASFIEDCSSIRDGSLPEDPDQTPAASLSANEDHNAKAPSRPRLTTRRSSRRVPQPGPHKSVDSMAHMYTRAADILRDATLADGCAIFGASPGSGRANSIKTAFGASPAETAHPSPASDSDKHDTNTSDSDSSPAARPCKILAYSLADEQARADIETGTALTLGTLDKYFALFPQGRTFSFTSEGAGVSSEDDSASDKEVRQRASSIVGDGKDKPRTRKRRMDHKELLKKIPGAKNVIFLPLFDHGEERLIAGCFLWTSVTGRMMLDADLSYLRAFSNCIVSEVVRMNMQKNEASKTTFIASMSHELRSPLHGILGAAEFLTDTMTDAYQSGLITSIVTCGRTLLDTLNHVLDYSKINKLGRAQMRRHARQNKLVNLASDSSLESLNMTAEIDLGVLVEEVAEAVTAGHSFKRLPGAGTVASFDALTSGKRDAIANAQGSKGRLATHPLVLLDISPRRSWLVRVQPGALRRVIMNLLGNALKYTESGFVAVSLRAQESTSNSKIDALIRVVDSGKGMSDTFQKDKLFLPFSQEDPFQPGTGLGLSIVKQIVDSLGGSIEVTSQQNVGTEIDVRLSLTPVGSTTDQTPDPEMLSMESRTRGKHLVMLDVPREGSANRPPTDPVARLEQTVREACTRWFGMRVTRSSNLDESQDADFYIFCEPPPVETLIERNRQSPSGGQGIHGEVPVIIVCLNDEEAISISRKHQTTLRELGRVVEVVPQPCGPRKLAKVFNHCLERVEEVQNNPRTPEPTDTPMEHSKKSPDVMEDVRHTNSKDLGKTMSAAISYPTAPPIDPTTPALQKRAYSDSASSRANTSSGQATPAELHLLLVDDNKINRQLLVMFMKKCNFSYREAENGLEAVEEYKASCLPGPQTSQPGRQFDFVLMDISMPVLDGMEATRRIREFESENGLKKTNVIALTGLASAQAQADAETAGIDVFLPKPVKFAELRRLVDAAPRLEGS
ncbi:hypothetical protein M409DRAFT_26446 [Zasmidium cellare ATCC 36951]|uniref:histidine kinase n=1 Tax=Zasmidium cellare ATCC 36951 TaxID=1080233 RepID=A0A6A6C9S9_ZASCE|nr:uncharacterized protein M409DRAFT_26446 [Zasmidium cellare ATCC 36951]KAF2162998.1 hypothetical protein M409DRAFT_26446 [Zasmidium cellare ATCC 36951]